MIIANYLFVTFILLIFAHYLADYALQNDFIANAKNHTTLLGKTYWKWVLPGHGGIHALGVYVVTSSMPLAIAEWVAHTYIDYCKCDGRINFNTDQILHVLCKVVYIVIIGFALCFPAYFHH